MIETYEVTAAEFEIAAAELELEFELVEYQLELEYECAQAELERMWLSGDYYI